MSAAELHRLFANTEVGEEYEGGFQLRRPVDNRITGSVRVESRHGDIDLVLSVDGGRGCSTTVSAMEPAEARELALALERAAAAAERAREQENE